MVLVFAYIYLLVICLLQYNYIKNINIYYRIWSTGYGLIGTKIKVNKNNTYSKQLKKYIRVVYKSAF